MTERTIAIRIRALTSDFSSGLTGMARQSEQFASTHSKAMGTAGKASMGLGAAMMLTAGSFGKANMRFESELTKLTTLIGVSTDEMEKMGQAALSLGHTGRGPQELAEAAFFVESAGLRGAEALGVMEASAKASAIGLGETKTVADLATSAVNAYGSEVMSGAQATDVMVGAVREGKAEASELAGAMGMVLPVASEMGVSFDEVGAATAAMTRTGTDAGTATMQLRQILSSLLKPAAESEEALAGIGLSSQQLRDVIREDGLWAAMDLLKTSVGDNDTAMAKILPNVRALSGFLDIMGANAAENEQIFARMADTAGLTDEAFEKWGETSEAAAQRMSAAWEAFRIEMGEGVAPILATVAGGLESVAGLVRSMPQPLKSATAGFMLIGGAVFFVGGAALWSVPKIIMLNTQLARMGGIAGASRAALAGTARFLLGPYSVAAAAGTKATYDLVSAFREGTESAEQMHDEIVATSDSAEQASRRTVIALGEHVDAVTSVEAAWERLKRGFSFDVVGDVVRDGAKAWKLWRSDAGDATEATLRGKNAIDLLSSGVGGWVDRVREGTWVTEEMRAAAADAGVDIDALTGDVEGLSEATEELTESQERAKAALELWGGPAGVYSNLMADLEEAERERAQALAEANEDGKASWQDFAADVSVSLTAYAEALEEQNRNIDEWEDNLVAVAMRAGSDVAMILADMGEEGVDLVAKMATGTDEETTRLANALRANVDRGGEQAGIALAARMETLERIAAEGGKASGGALARELGEAIPEVARIARQYGIDVSGPLASILEAIGDARSATAVRNFIRGDRITGLNAGGPVPGSGPDRDSVVIGATPGEYVVRRAMVDRYGVDTFDALNSGRLDDHELDHLAAFNTGGLIPAPPDFPYRGIGRSADHYARNMYERSSAWADSNAPVPGELGARVPPGGGSTIARLIAMASGVPNRVTSTYRPNSPTFHGLRRAVDFADPAGPRPQGSAAMMAIFNELLQYGANLKELFYTPAGFSIKNGRRTAPIAASTHRSHVHSAMYAGGIIPEEVFGVGASGRTYSFGESGPERVSPLSRGSAPVTLGDVPIAEWEELKRRGWKGDPTDSAERLYPPAPANQVGGAYANFYPEGANAQTRRSINDNLFSLGIMPLDDHLSNLRKRMDAEVRFSDEWMRLHNDITRLMDDEAAKEREAAEEAQRLAEEAQRFAEQIAGNRAQWEFERMDPRGQLTDLTRRIAAEREFTDEWMDLTRQRDRLSEQVAADELRRIEDLQRARDTELDTLNRLLDERQRILDQMADAQARHDQQAVQARERYADQARQATARRNEQLLALEERFADERRRIVEGRASSLFAALPIETRAAREWANTISQVLANETERTMQRSEWLEGLDMLRGMGLSEDAIATFGLEDLTEQSLAKVRLWSGATEDEIAALNEAIAQRQSFAADRAEDEASRHLGAVGEALIELTRQTAESSSQIHAEHAQAMRDARAELGERLDELGETLTEDLTRLQGELAQIGVDQGRTYSQAIAEGIASGLPAIQAQVRRVQAAMRQLKEAQAGQGSAGINPNMPIADLRAYARRIGYDDDLAHLRSRIRTKGYDAGGWLPPNSATLAINNTAKWEPVGMGTHMAAPQVNMQAPAVDVQVFVGGKQLKGDVEVWVDGRLAQRNQTSQIAGARG